MLLLKRAKIPRGLRKLSVMLAKLLSVVVISACLWAGPSACGVEFRENGAFDTDFGWQKSLPSEFGRGEFTLEVRFRADASYPIGPTRPKDSIDQRKNWAEADLEPYSEDEWWWKGNFLLDGHNNWDLPAGTFSLQFYGGGRLRWLFGDGESGIVGGNWGVQVYPATSAPTLVDDRWHWVATVRRWNETQGGADLELWIDGARVATEHSPARTDLRTYWDDWSGFPPDQRPGWIWGGERQVAFRILEQYEDFKGDVSDIRFWSIARTPETLAAVNDDPIATTTPGLVGLYRLSEEFGGATCNEISRGDCIEFILDDRTWRLGFAHLSGAEGFVAILALTGIGTMALRASKARRDRQSMRIWSFAGAVLAALFVFTLLDLPTLFEQTAKTVARAQGWYGLRRPYQILAILAVAAACGLALRRALGGLAEASKATGIVAATSVVLLGIILVRTASLHLTDALLQVAVGPVALGRGLEALCVVAMVAAALATGRPIDGDRDEVNG